MTLTIRDAQLGDADRLGAVQVRAWQATYRGVMPDTYLDELNADDRAAYWHRQMLALLPGQRLKVIVDDGLVVGFAAAGPEHGGRAAGIGELYAINLDPQVWGRGLGRALLRDVTADLVGLGYREAVLWVVPQNDRARRFYESEEWGDDHVRRDDEVFGVVVPEMRYRRALATSSAHERYYHGTRAELTPGDLIGPGYRSNYGSRKHANHVYLTATVDAAVWGAELADGDGPGRIYIVEPTGPVEDDPNLTDKKFPGNPTKSYRSRDPLRVMGELTDWEGHDPDVLQSMKDHLKHLEELGIEAIDD